MIRVEQLTLTHEGSTLHRAHTRPTSAPATGAKARTRRPAAPGFPHTARARRTPPVTRSKQLTVSRAGSSEPAHGTGERPSGDATETPPQPPTALPTTPHSPAPHPLPVTRFKQLPILREDTPHGVDGRQANAPATETPRTTLNGARFPASGRSPAPHPHPEDPLQ
ncbi:hypothetical protein [Streptomyces sulphureus]|uniref:hypothetical protein n=1 Tax=Streptomyces sulphureus TaxID=47758 RepID=UPI00039F2723|nr:hypothetical protein [Streptomyces sulphureus]